MYRHTDLTGDKWSLNILAHLTRVSLTNKCILFLYIFYIKHDYNLSLIKIIFISRNLSTEESGPFMTKTFPFDCLVAKFHMLSTNDIIYCKSGQEYIIKGNICQTLSHNRRQIVIPKIEVPSDVCSDDFGNIYVSGKGSNTIHRLTEEGNVLDIPLASQHGIKQPIAICFNQDYTKLYIANEWGKKVLVFRVH